MCGALVAAKARLTRAACSAQLSLIFANQSEQDILCRAARRTRRVAAHTRDADARACHARRRSWMRWQQSTPTSRHAELLPYPHAVRAPLTPHAAARCFTRWTRRPRGGGGAWGSSTRPWCAPRRLQTYAAPRADARRAQISANLPPAGKSTQARAARATPARALLSVVHPCTGARVRPAAHDQVRVQARVRAAGLHRGPAHDLVKRAAVMTLCARTLRCFVKVPSVPSARPRPVACTSRVSACARCGGRTRRCACCARCMPRRSPPPRRRRQRSAPRAPASRRTAGA